MNVINTNEIFLHLTLRKSLPVFQLLLCINTLKFKIFLHTTIPTTDILPVLTNFTIYMNENKYRSIINTKISTIHHVKHTNCEGNPLFIIKNVLFIRCWHKITSFFYFSDIIKGE